MGERGDQGFEVVPTRIGGAPGPGRRGRRPRSPIVLLILLAVTIPTIAWAGPRIEWRPEVDLSFLRPTPTPVPSRTPRPLPAPTRPVATPLAPITVGVGPHPTAPFPVDVGGLRLADPAVGTLGSDLGMRGDTDAIFTGADGQGWFCVCFVRVQEGSSETVTVEVRRVDKLGRMMVKRAVREYHSSAKTDAQDFYTRFDLVTSPDRGRAYLSSATRSGDEWTIELETIDLRTGVALAHTPIGSITIPPLAEPTPPPDQGPTENYFSGTFLRMSPDGRRLLLWSWVDVYSPTNQQQPAIPRGWLLEVGDGSAGLVVTDLGALASTLRTCYWLAWLTPDELAAICWPPDQTRQTLAVRLFDVDGRERGHLDLADAMNSWLADPLLDRENRLLFLWQPADHVFSRIDLDALTMDQLKVDAAATAGASGGSGTDTEPGPGPAHRWATFASDLHMWYTPHLLGEPGKARIFALGILPDTASGRSYTSSGIWVFDANRLQLLDRWDPLTAYGSIGLSNDGRWLLAAGSSGTNERGEPANWQSSITIHDVSDGRPALQLGSLGNEVQVFQVPP